MPVWLEVVLGISAGVVAIALIVRLVLRSEERPRKRRSSWLAPHSGEDSSI